MIAIDGVGDGDLCEDKKDYVRRAKPPILLD